MKLTLRTLLIVTLFASCEKFFEFEKESILDKKTQIDKYVIEAVIQKGYPAYAFVTKSEPYFSPVSPNTLNTIFVTDADITITDADGKSVQLVNINDILSFGILDSIAQLFPGFYIEWPIDGLNISFTDQNEIDISPGPYNTIEKMANNFNYQPSYNKTLLLPKPPFLKNI